MLLSRLAQHFDTALQLPRPLLVHLPVVFAAFPRAFLELVDGFDLGRRLLCNRSGY
jgi:hypothetical protein